MSEKVSFKFCAKKRHLLVTKPKQREEKLEYISSIEEKKIRLLNGEVEEKKKELLVIPLNRSVASTVSKLSSEIRTYLNDKNCEVEEIVKVEVNNEDLLRAAAIKELIQQPRTDDGHEQTLTVPLASNPPIGEEESTIDDYEDVPIKEFGMAMLRGMGWSPGQGIGKSGKVAEVNMPQLRPSGMGLGADKVQKKDKDSQKRSHEKGKSVSEHRSSKERSRSHRSEEQSYGLSVPTKKHKR